MILPILIGSKVREKYFNTKSNNLKLIIEESARVITCPTAPSLTFQDNAF
jgi:hypothetical protein